MSSYSKIEGSFQKATIVESLDRSSQTLRSNRHPTAGSPVSAGHKRITDTLPTVNPRLRAPLPLAAVAFARRPPARDQSPGQHTVGYAVRAATARDPE